MNQPNTSLPGEDIILKPVEEGDYLTLAILEAVTFDTDDFSVVAFGPDRHSQHNLKISAQSIAAQPTRPNERKVNTKAIIIDPVTNVEKIVGFAGWAYVTNRQDAPKEVKKEEETIKVEMTAEQKKKSDEENWGVGANVKFCEDAFLVADEFMLKSCKGGDYCKLRTIVVHPKYQRRGIGTRLIKEGLVEADRLGLQSILAASPEGEDLYKRFGFEEYHVMNFDLREYKGGEGMGVARHCIMHRPTQVRKKV